MKLPYYMIEFSASSCLFEIRVNDNPIVTLNLKGQASTKMPINHAISKSGEQSISVSIYPLIGETQLRDQSELYYDIKVYDVEKSFDLKEQFEGFKSKKVKNTSKIPFIKHTQIFNAEIPYNLKNLWESGEKIEDVKDYDNKIRKTYLSLGNKIKNKEYDFYEKAIQNREFNMKNSMYLSETESRARINRVLNDFKNGFDLMILAENSIPIISANGKKVALKMTNGEPALSFVNEKTKEQLMLDIEFYFNKETKQFEII